MSHNVIYLGEITPPDAPLPYFAVNDGLTGRWRVAWSKHLIPAFPAGSARLATVKNGTGKHTALLAILAVCLPGERGFHRQTGFIRWPSATAWFTLRSDWCQDCWLPWLMVRLRARNDSHWHVFEWINRLTHDFARLRFIVGCFSDLLAPYGQSWSVLSIKWTCNYRSILWFVLRHSCLIEKPCSHNGRKT